MTSNFNNLFSKNDVNKPENKPSHIDRSQLELKSPSQNNNRKKSHSTKKQDKSQNYGKNIENSFLTDKNPIFDEINYNYTYDENEFNKEIKNIRTKSYHNMNHKIPIDELGDLRDYFQEKIRALNRYVKLLKERIEHVNDKCNKVPSRRIDQIERRLTELMGYKKERTKSVGCVNNRKFDESIESKFEVCVKCYRDVLNSNHEFKQVIFDKVDLLENKINLKIQDNIINYYDAYDLNDFKNTNHLMNEINLIKQEVNQFKEKTNAHIKKVYDRIGGPSTTFANTHNSDDNLDDKLQTIIESRIQLFTSKLDRLTNDKINYVMNVIQENTDKLKKSSIKVEVEGENNRRRKSPTPNTLNDRLFTEVNIIKKEFDSLYIQQKTSKTETINFVHDNMLETNNNINKLKTEMSRYNHQVGTLTSDIQLLQRDISFLKGQLSGTSFTNKISELQVNDSSNKINHFELNGNQQENDIQNIYTQINTLTNDLVSAKNEIESMKKNPSLINDINSVKDTLKSIISNNKSLANDIILIKSRAGISSPQPNDATGYTDELSILKNKIQDLENNQNSIKSISDDMVKLKSQLEQKQNDIDLLSKDINEFKSTSSDNENANRIAEHISSLSSQFESVKGKLENKLNQSGSKIETVMLQIKGTSDRIETVYSAFRDLSDEINKLKSQVVSMLSSSSPKLQGIDFQVNRSLYEEINNLKERVNEIQRLQTSSIFSSSPVRYKESGINYKDLYELAVESYPENSLGQDLSEIHSENHMFKEQIREINDNIEKLKIDMFNNKSELISYTDKRINSILDKLNIKLTDTEKKHKTYSPLKFKHSDEESEVFLDQGLDSVKSLTKSQENIQFDDHIIESSKQVKHQKPIESSSNIELSGEREAILNTDISPNDHEYSDKNIDKSQQNTASDLISIASLSTNKELMNMNSESRNEFGITLDELNERLEQNNEFLIKRMDDIKNNLENTLNKTKSVLTKRIDDNKKYVENVKNELMQNIQSVNKELSK